MPDFNRQNPEEIVLSTNDEKISVQNPLPTNGDSVYFKDLDIDNCTASGFTFDVGSGTEEEVVKSFVSSVFTGKSNNSITNPKTIYLQFNRPILTSSFGINSAPGKYFSNAKVVLAQGEYSWTAYDDSSDNTQHQIFLFPTGPVKFSSMTITFHTANEIGIGLIGIFKNIEVVSRIQALKPDGTVTDVDATAGGNLKFSLEEFDSTFLGNPLPVRDPLLEIAKGNVTGHSGVNKFGHVEDIDISDVPVDIWNGGSVWVAPTAARTHDIVSDDVNDDVGDTGARTINIQGLDSNWELQEEVIPMNGTTNVATANTYVRIFRMYVVTVGSSLTNEGNITATAQVDGTVTAAITTGKGQTLMAIYTIPAGKTGYITKGYTTITRQDKTSGAMAEFEFRGRFDADVSTSPWRTLWAGGISVDGSSAYEHSYSPYVAVSEKTDLVFRCIYVSDNNTKIGAGFDIILIDD
ncbi:MAG: hypothetical protein ACTSQE_07410 [Candidatus Heimdallarchaeaceae archaeon]